MKSSVKFLLIIFFFFINFVGCEPLCGSGNPLPYFDTKGIRGVYNLKDSGHSTISNEEVSIVDYRLSVILDATYYAFFQKNGYNTMACSPLENGYKGTNEKIDYIKITADKPYDNKHEANTSLNDLILKFNYNYQKSTESLEDYLKKSSYVPSIFGLDLTFSTPPSKKQSLIFTIEYALTNGEKYTAKTLPVVIF
jgi:hypothetical protein